MKKRFADLLAADAPACGTWSQLASPEVIDILAATGFIFTIIDTEHGYFGLETAENLIRACDAGGLVPLLRIPGKEPWMITKALDCGAAGVVVPGVGSAAEARAAVAAAAYAPRGRRGACPCVRATDHLTLEWSTHARRANAETGIIALIESPEGVADFEAILAVDGLLAVLLGPFDLSVAMGHEGDFTHPEVMAALAGMARQANLAGVPVIMPVFSPELSAAREQIAHWQALGVRLFTVGTDKLLFAQHCRSYLQGLRTVA